MQRAPIKPVIEMNSLSNNWGTVLGTVLGSLLTPSTLSEKTDAPLQLFQRPGKSWLVLTLVITFAGTVYGRSSKKTGLCVIGAFLPLGFFLLKWFGVLFGASDISAPRTWGAAFLDTASPLAGLRDRASLTFLRGEGESRRTPGAPKAWRRIGDVGRGKAHPPFFPR